MFTRKCARIEASIRSVPVDPRSRSRQSYEHNRPQPAGKVGGAEDDRRECETGNPSDRCTARPGGSALQLSLDHAAKKRFLGHAREQEVGPRPDREDRGPFGIVTDLTEDVRAKNIRAAISRRTAGSNTFSMAAQSIREASSGGPNARRRRPICALSKLRYSV